jgi:diaminobutyrate-2-oxoglutarate transaminase
MFDINRRRYIDFLAGAGSLDYGYNDPVCTQAMVSYIQRGGIAHSLDLYTSAKREFLRVLKQNIVLPRGFEYVVQFPGPTGENAVEAALKLARKVTGRSNVISFTNGFNGVMLGA